MNRDVMEAHLVVLGWWPVKFKPYKYYKGWVYGVRSERQWCGEMFNRMQVDYLGTNAECHEIEWWIITDDVLRKITQTVDSVGVGGWDGE